MTRTLILGLLLLGACAPTPGPSGPPRSTAPAGSGNRELEPPNALPPGFTTANPLTPATGVVGRTRVP